MEEKKKVVKVKAKKVKAIKVKALPEGDTSSNDNHAIIAESSPADLSSKETTTNNTEIIPIEISTNETSSTNSKLSETIVKTKQWAIHNPALAAIIALVLVVCIAFPLYRHYVDSKIDTMAVICLKDYKNMLKNPSSMVVKGDIVKVTVENSMGGSMSYYYFTASGQNDFGAMVESTPAYDGLNYVGNMEDLYDIDYNDLEKTAKLLIATNIYKAATMDDPDLAPGINILGIEYLPGKQIAKKAEVGFVEQ